MAEVFLNKVFREKMETVKALAFDVNGTLVADTPEPFLTVINMMLRKLGKEPVPHKKLRQELGWPWTKIFRSRGIFEAKHSDHYLYNLYNDFYSSFATPALARNVPFVLKELKRRRFKLFIVTSQMMPVTLPAIRSVLDFFDGTLYGVLDKSLALKSISESHGKSAYIGDEVSDIFEAKKAGAAAVAYTGGLHFQYALEEAEPDFLIHSFRELLELPIFEEITKLSP